MNIENNTYNAIKNNSKIVINNMENPKITNQNKEIQNINKIEVQNVEMILKSIGQPIDEKNILILQTLIKNLKPITKQNIEIFNKSFKMFNDNIIEKALFFVENNIDITKTNAKQLEGHISKDISLNKQIDDFIESLLTFPNNKMLIKKLFQGEISEKNILKFTKIQDEIKQFEKLVYNELDKNEIKSNDKNKKLNLQSDDLFTKLIFNKNNAKNIKIFLNANIKNTPEANKNQFEVKNNEKQVNQVNNDNMNNSKINTNKQIFYSIKDNMKNVDISLIENLLKQIKQTPKFTKKIKEILNNVALLNKDIKNKFTMKNEKMEIENLEEIFTRIKKLSNKINNLAQKDIELTEVNKNMQEINKNMEFMSSIKESTYIQLPIIINNFETEAELYIFKDKNKSKKNKNSNNGSALISLNTMNLGKLETYINKIDDKISIQFRLENEKIQNIIKENINMLEKYLEQKNLKIADVSFKSIDQNFTLISNINNMNSDNKDFNDIILTSLNIKV